MTTKGKILIADDNKYVRRKGRSFFEQQAYKVSECSTIEDAIKLIKREKFDVVILDTCNMEGRIEGVIRVLKVIEKESPTTQAVIWSGMRDIKVQVKNFKCVRGCFYKEEEEIEKILKCIDEIMRQQETSPTTKETPPAKGIRVGNSLITDPFDIPLSMVGKLDFETYDKLYKMLDEKYGEQINHKFIETEARTIVVYKDFDGKVKLAGKSNSPYYPSDDELKNMEAEKGKVCYVIGRDNIIEETGCIGKSEWTFIPKIPENPYPTIPIYLGRKDEECKNIISQERLIIADFDTGNPDTLAFKDEYRKKLKIPEGRIRVIKDIFGGDSYFYSYVKKVKIGLCDSKDDKKFCCAEFEVLFVLNWGSSFFTTRQSSLRTAFVGRALWLPDKLRFSVILNAKDEKVMFSQVEL